MTREQFFDTILAEVGAEYADELKKAFELSDVPDDIDDSELIFWGVVTRETFRQTSEGYL